MLVMDPAKRITVDKILDSAYLQPVREPRLEVSAGFTVDVADVEAMVLTKPNLQRMMFEEIRLYNEGASPHDSGALETARSTVPQQAAQQQAQAPEEAYPPPMSAGPMQPSLSDPMEESLNANANAGPGDAMQSSLR